MKNKSTQKYGKYGHDAVKGLDNNNMLHKREYAPVKAQEYIPEKVQDCLRVEFHRYQALVWFNQIPLVVIPAHDLIQIAPDRITFRDTKFEGRKWGSTSFETRERMSVALVKDKQYQGISHLTLTHSIDEGDV